MLKVNHPSSTDDELDPSTAGRQKAYNQGLGRTTRVGCQRHQILGPTLTTSPRSRPHKQGQNSHGPRQVGAPTTDTTAPLFPRLGALAMEAVFLHRRPANAPLCCRSRRSRRSPLTRTARNASDYLPVWLAFIPSFAFAAALRGGCCRLVAAAVWWLEASRRAGRPRGHRHRRLRCPHCALHRDFAPFSGRGDAYDGHGRASFAACSRVRAVSR